MGDQGTEMLLNIPGGQIAAKGWGPPYGEPVLAIHGWLDNANSFDPLSRELPGLRIVAIDLPGHGRSRWRHEGATYQFTDWLPDAVAVLDALGWERCTLMGHSLGAAIASMLGAVIPRRVERLILLEGLGPSVTEADEAPDRLIRSLAERNRIPKKRPPPYADQEEVAQRLQSVIPNLNIECARTLAERGSKEADGLGYTWSSDPRLRGTSPLRLTEEHVRAFLRRIECKTLLVRATNGYPAYDAMSGRTECIKDLHMLRLEGSHHVHMEAPKEIARAVMEFMEHSA